MLTLRCSDTHIYPGATMRADAPPPDLGETPCLVEFADGVQAPARLLRGSDALYVSVAAYSTARGTRISAKRWRLEARAGGHGATLRITSRAPDPA